MQQEAEAAAEAVAAAPEKEEEIMEVRIPRMDPST